MHVTICHPRRLKLELVILSDKWTKHSLYLHAELVRHKQLDDASTHKNANTHAGTVFLPHDLDLRPLDPKINGFPEIMILCQAWWSSFASFFDISSVETGKQRWKQRPIFHVFVCAPDCRLGNELWSDREQVFGVDDHRRKTLVFGAMLFQVLLTEDAVLDACSAASCATTTGRLGLPSTTHVEQWRRKTRRQIARVHLHTPRQWTRTSQHSQECTDPRRQCFLSDS